MTVDTSPRERELELLTQPRREIIHLLKERGTLCVDAASEALGQSRTATRAHLLHLEERGMIERVKLETNKRGRPPLAFKLTSEGESLFPRDDSEVLTDLLLFIKQQGQSELLEAFFEKLWAERFDEFERELAARGGEPDDLIRRVAALEAVLIRSHFMPRLEVLDGGEVERFDHELSATPPDALRLRECNCPFPAVVRATKIPCRMEVEFLSKVFGRKPSRARFIHQGHSACVYDFISPPDSES